MTSLSNPILAEGRTHLQHVLQCRNLQVWYDIEIWHSLEPGWYRCFARASSLEGKLLASEFLDTLRRLSGVDSDGDEPVELVPYSNKTQLEGTIPHPMGGPMKPGTYVYRCVNQEVRLRHWGEECYQMDRLRSLDKPYAHEEDDREWDLSERNSPTSLALRTYARDNVCVICNAAGRSEGAFYGNRSSAPTLRTHRIVPLGVLDHLQMHYLGAPSLVQDPFVLAEIRDTGGFPAPVAYASVGYDKWSEEAMRVGNMGLNSLDNTMLLCPQHSQWMDRSYFSINPKTRRLHAFHPIARDFHGLELRRPFAHANEWLPAPHVNMLSWHFDRSIIGWTSGHGQFVEEGIRKVNEEDSSDEDSDRDDVRSR